MDCDWLYARLSLREVNAEREGLGKKPIEDASDDDDDPEGGATVEKAVSTTDPDSGMFVKGEHERQFAYEAHTACDKRKETMERVFGDAKEKHAMRYMTYRGLARVTNWVRLKFAAMNLKKLAMWMCKTSTSVHLPALFFVFSKRTAVFVG